MVWSESGNERRMFVDKTEIRAWQLVIDELSRIADELKAVKNELRGIKVKMK